VPPAPPSNFPPATIAVGNTPYGEVRARAAGGIEITVPSQADEVHLRRDSTAPGSFAKLAITSERIGAIRDDGRETLLIDVSNGDVTVGTQNVEGDVIVRNAANQNAVQLDGAPGDVWFRGALRDYGNRHPGVNHSQLGELTTGGLTVLHRHAARLMRPFVAWLWCPGNTPVGTFIDINLPGPTPIVACTSLHAMDPSGLFVGGGEGFFTEVHRINLIENRAPGGALGTPTAPFTGTAATWFIGGAHFGPNLDIANLKAPYFRGTATSVRFRCRSMGPTDAWALCLVFPEL
jgi:hypothetical protein